VGFHINVYNMPRINDYKHAKEIFNSKTVVRGENQSVRRLGDRYEKEKWLRQEIRDGIEVYVAGYYDTELVRFYPTHKEITLGSFPSLSTQYFVGYISGINLHQFEHKAYVPAPFTRSPMVKNNHIEAYVNLSGDRYHMNANDWYAITYDNKPLYPEQFEKPVKYKFDASQMRGLRKPYKNLLKYADTILKLSPEGLERDAEIDKQIPQGYDNLLEFFKHEDNVYASFYFIVRQTQRYYWGNSGSRNYHVNIGMIKRYLDKALKIENPQVLVEVVKPVTNS
jgi:hypothetical protein